MERKLERKLDLRSIRRSPTRMLLAGYLTVILIGTVLLMLPVSSREGIVTPVTDSFFTAVSAACVTGLVRFDTYTHWSLFGQIVLLLLIFCPPIPFRARRSACPPASLCGRRWQRPR